MNNDKEHLFEMLGKEIAFIFNNDGSFLQEFASMKYIDLVEVSFTNILIKYVYMDIKGEHIADFISLDHYYKWKKKKSPFWSLS